MLIACGNNIYPCRVDTAVTEDIGELGDVLFQLVECSRKQMTEIVGKHLIGINVSLHTQGFHLPPDVCAVNRLA